MTGREELVERVARVIELAIIRHGVPEEALEGTLDDAEAALEAAGVAALQARVEALDSLPINFELSWGELDEPSECAWQVHRVNGGRNDREWTLVATGETPSEAIRAALAKQGGHYDE